MSSIKHNLNCFKCAAEADLLKCDKAAVFDVLLTYFLSAGGVEQTFALSQMARHLSHLPSRVFSRASFPFLAASHLTGRILYLFVSEKLPSARN